MNTQDSLNCPVCDVPDDAQHILIVCARCVNSRRSLQEALAKLDNRPFDIGKVLGPWPPCQRRDAALVQFTRDIGAAGEYSHGDGPLSLFSYSTFYASDTLIYFSSVE